MDDMDRAIVNALQGGFPVSETPFADAAKALGLTAEQLITRIRVMKEQGVLSRFGPMYNADRFGGHNTLVAMEVPADRFDEVAEIVNSFPEVAHNYQRDHRLNMWFVIAAESRERVARVLTEVQDRTGLVAHDLPKLTEFHIGLKFEA
ncbi:AsnC family transcriptional regulator [Magnetospirillum sp. 64-120]|uniref:Lrp/AsnC family transcriptional regulator n=1 Tax=Magnetospirillum sp. 64-120 TaxID=1895778 RepID=UPI00092B6F0B|nr:AsnC family transcriptional regulator [Magnetospirillum sp. 64-120]OJX72144.1 MAG: AsnC family protein [Magnetospirillum sp. 64-120]